MVRGSEWGVGREPFFYLLFLHERLPQALRVTLNFTLHWFGLLAGQHLLVVPVGFGGTHPAYWHPARSQGCALFGNSSVLYVQYLGHYLGHQASPIFHGASVKNDDQSSGSASKAQAGDETPRGNLDDAFER